MSQPSRVIHELKGGLHRLIINGKVSRWEPELLPCKVKLLIEGVERTYYASADLQSGLPEIFTAQSIYGETKVVATSDSKKVEFKTLDEL
jgi:hypothetical protein